MRPPPLPALAAVGALLLAGCTTVLQPPAAPARPAPAFLLDPGRHATLVLPGPRGGLVRYAYGDWAYYGRNRTGLLRGLGALLWPTRASLARRELAGPANREDARFAQYGANRRHNPWYDLTFVPLPETYSLVNNSNQRTAAWLEELGVTVRGLALWSRWRVEGP